ncbi:MAG TPA: hypothetical protein VII24_08355 [Pseudolabrys sp.]
MASVIGLAFVLAAAAPADAAKARKHKKVAGAHAAVRVQSGHRGTNLFPAGPLYNGQDYLGDDPDPFIRLQIYRDLGARYGGEN